jgi:hypothetical protein
MLYTAILQKFPDDLFIFRMDRMFPMDCSDFFFNKI